MRWEEPPRRAFHHRMNPFDPGDNEIDHAKFSSSRSTRTTPAHAFDSIQGDLH